MFPIETAIYIGRECLAARHQGTDAESRATGPGVPIFDRALQPTLFNWLESKLWSPGDRQRTERRLRQAIAMAEVEFRQGLAAFLLAVLAWLLTGRRPLDGAARRPSEARADDVATPRVLAPGGKSSVYIPTC